MTLTLFPATPDALVTFAASLPQEDAGYGRPDLFARAVAVSRAADVLCDGESPVAVLGVSEGGNAWMHSVAAFRCPLAAFRIMRRRFREWAAAGDVVCAIPEASGRPVRVMRLIAKTESRDGVAAFTLKGDNNVL